MQRQHIASIALFWATRILAIDHSIPGFCFDEHVPGYYAVIRQTATERSKINRNESPMILSTDGLSGVKSGLFIGTDGVYLDKKDADSVLAETRKSTPDAYIKFLGSYTNQQGISLEKACSNCWCYVEKGKAIHGKFVAKNGWLIQQDGAPDYLLPSQGEPAEDHLCAFLVGSVGWLLLEELEEDECCTKYRFKLLSFRGVIQDGRSFSIGDGPEYNTIQVVADPLAGPSVELLSNGKLTEEWSVVRNKFARIR
jgi:hypothetical protein